MFLQYFRPVGLMGEVSENSTNHSAVAGVNSRDGFCFACVSPISDLVPCMGHFKVRGAGDSVMEPFKNWGCRSVIMSPSCGHLAARLKGPPRLTSPTTALH